MVGACMCVPLGIHLEPINRVGDIINCACGPKRELYNAKWEALCANGRRTIQAYQKHH